MIRNDRYFIYLIMLSLFMVLFIGSNSRADDTGTIVLKSGEKYENINYNVDRYYKVIKFEYDDEKKNVSFVDIESVFDSDGNDITERLLGRHYKPQNETWISEKSEVIKKARSKIWDVMFRLEGNYSIPSGDYYDGIKSGIGFGGNVHFAVTHQLAVMALVSKSGMTVDEGFRLYSADPNFTIRDQNYSISTIRYLVAIDYYRHIDREKTDKSLFYIYTGLGAAVHDIKMKATLEYVPTGELTYIDESSNESKFILSLGLGFVKSVSRDIGVSFDANMDLVHVGTVKSDYYGEDVVYAYIFDLKLGLVYFL